MKPPKKSPRKMDLKRVQKYRCVLEIGGRSFCTGARLTGGRVVHGRARDVGKRRKRLPVVAVGAVLEISSWLGFCADL